MFEKATIVWKETGLVEANAHGVPLFNETTRPDDGRARSKRSVCNSLKRSVVYTALAGAVFSAVAEERELYEMDIQDGMTIAIDADNTVIKSQPRMERKLRRSQRQNTKRRKFKRHGNVEVMPFETLDGTTIDPYQANGDSDPSQVLPATNGDPDALEYTELSFRGGMEGEIGILGAEPPPTQWTLGGAGDITLFPEEGELSLENGPNDGGIGTQDFGSFTQISNPDRYPYRLNARLRMQWPNGVATTCSGTLIDSRHALTAAHCIYNHDRGGWATTVEVQPSYNNDVSPVYGSAFNVSGSQNLLTWTPWINNRNHDYDIGVVYLNRPIGALTGWYGYGYTTCDRLKTRTWYVGSYPGERGFDAETMQYQHGDYDECPSEHIAQRRTPGIGGQSGGGVYQVRDYGRFVGSVMSKNVWNWFHGTDLNAVRFNYLKYSDVVRWVNVHTPSTPDLIPMDVQVRDAYTSPGYAVSGMTYLVHNYSKAARSGNFTVKVYLSTNNYISKYDTLVQTHSVNTYLGAKSSMRVTVPTFNIPISTPYGDKYVGVIIEDADANTGNNHTPAQDAFKIRVL